MGLSMYVTRHLDESRPNSEDGYADNNGGELNAKCAMMYPPWVSKEFHWVK